jgi:hypothetical protein
VLQPFKALAGGNIKSGAGKDNAHAQRYAGQPASVWAALSVCNAQEQALQTTRHDSCFIDALRRLTVLLSVLTGLRLRAIFPSMPICRRYLQELAEREVVRAAASGNLWYCASHPEHVRPMLQVRLRTLSRCTVSIAQVGR